MSPRITIPSRPCNWPSIACLDEDTELLKGKRLDKDYFNTLLTGGDPVRDLLSGLTRAIRSNLARDGPMTGAAFVGVCKSQLAFDPENDGNPKWGDAPAVRKGPWRPVGSGSAKPRSAIHTSHCKFESVRRPTTPFSGAWTTAPMTAGPNGTRIRSEIFVRIRWPWATSLRLKPARNCWKLKNNMAGRRSLVWAELGESPLACAMEHLTTLAQVTGDPLTAGTLGEIVEVYRSSAWRADDAVLQGLSCVNRPEDLETIKTVIRAIYLPWAEDAARYLQKVVSRDGYPLSRETTTPPEPGKPGECVLFVDGLRFDVARRLSEKLASRSWRVKETPVWSAIPSVTATGKPAVTPVAHLIVGQEGNADFEPCVATSDQSLKGGYHLQKLLREAGWHLPDKSQDQEYEGPTWREVGNIDHEGHERGWKLARHLETILNEIVDRIEQWLEKGIKSIRVVTDHGWLLLPGGLPKTELPSSLTENQWGRRRPQGGCCH